ETVRAAQRVWICPSRKLRGGTARPALQEDKTQCWATVDATSGNPTHSGTVKAGPGFQQAGPAIGPASDVTSVRRRVSEPRIIPFLRFRAATSLVRRQDSRAF